MEGKRNPFYLGNSPEAFHAFRITYTATTSLLQRVKNSVTLVSPNSSSGAMVVAFQVSEFFSSQWNRLSIPANCAQKKSFAFSRHLLSIRFSHN